MINQGSIKLFAPAKINLLLAVLGLRDDGFHELVTIMHQISLTDIVHLELSALPGIRIHTTDPRLGDDESNLAYQSAARYLDLTGINQGVNILIEKRIPLGAGLAGGSTDAAAVLKGMNQLHGQLLPAEQMYELAAHLGSDVPFCLLGGTALAAGRGEKLTPLPVTGIPYLVLVKPAINISTAKIYREWDRRGESCDPGFREMMANLQAGDWEQIARSLYNSLEPITASWVPLVEQIKQRLQERGAQGVLMSGSGPTVFGLFKTAEAAEKAYIQFKDEYNECYLVTSFRNQSAGHYDGGEA